MSYRLTLTFEITTNPTTVTIPIIHNNNNQLLIVVNWTANLDDPTITTGTLSHTYTATGTRTVGINGFTLTSNSVTAFGGLSWNGAPQLKSIQSTDTYWGLGTGVTSMYGLFHGTTSLLTSLPQHFPPSVTNMNEMFINSSCSPNISNWNVSNVTTMRQTFKNSTFSGDISGWDVSSVTDMYEMFENSTFNEDITRWDVRSVTNMVEMFKNATAFNRDIRGWFVKYTAARSNMFSGASAMNTAFGGTAYNTSSGTTGYSSYLPTYFFNNITVLYRDDTINADAYNFDIELPANVDVGYIMNGTDIGHVFTNRGGNFIYTSTPSPWSMSNYYVAGKYMTNGTSLTERFASSIKRPFVVSTVPPTFDATYVYYKFVDEVGGAEYTNTFRIISDNDIQDVLADVICVGGGGSGGNDVANWGSGGGGAGTVQIGETTFGAGTNDYTIHVGSRGTNNNSTQDQGASWITRTGYGIQVRSEQGGRGWDNGSGTNHGGSTGGGSGGSSATITSIEPDADTQATTATQNTYTNFTRYVNRGGGGSNNTGGGGGGGAGAVGNTATGYPGNSGGHGKQWAVDGNYYGGGGAGQGVWDYANQHGPAVGGGGSFYSGYSGAGTNGTGGGGAAAQAANAHNTSGAVGGPGGSGVVIIAIPKTLLAIPTPYQLLVWTTGSSYSTTSGIPAHVTYNTGFDTFTWHYGNTYAHVLCVGGGGGGGAANGYEGGGGGGGGTVSIGYISLTKGASYSITVGSGTTSNTTNAYPSQIVSNGTTLIQSRGGGRGGMRGGFQSDFSSSGWAGGTGGSGGGSGGAPWAYGYNGGEMGGANWQSYDNFSMYCSPGSGGYHNNYAGAGGGGAGVHPSNPVQYAELSAGGGYHWGGGGGGDGKEWEIDGNMYGGGGGGGGAADQVNYFGFGGPGGSGGGGNGDGWNVGGTGGTWGTGGGGGGGMTATTHGNAQAQGRIGGGGIVIFALIR